MKRIFASLLFVVAAWTTQAQTIPCLTGSLATGIIAFYPFPSGSLSDMSGNGHNLVNPTSAYPTADRFGNPICAMHFDKSAGDYIHYPITGASAFDNITTAPFSISLWYKPIGPRGPGDYELLIGRGFPGPFGHCPDTWEQWSVGLYDCRQAVVGFDQYSTWENAAGGVGCTAFQAGVTGSWHHLAFVYDGSVRKLYIDYTLYSVSSGPCGPMTSNIGDIVLGNDFTGDLDDVIIYDHDLTAGEVGALFQAGACCDSGVAQNDTCNILTGSLATGVLAFYPFPSGSLTDMSSNGNNLTNITTAYPTADRFGNPTCAYHFDKISGDYLNIPISGPSFIDNITSSPFSISLWYQPTGNRAIGAYELLIGRGTTASTVTCPDTWGEWSIGLYDCRKAVAGFDMNSTWQTTAMPCPAFMASVTGSWHHLALVFNGTTRSLFVDGTLYSVTAGGCGSLASNIGDLMLGRDYTGDLDDIVIYNRALSVTEVLDLQHLVGSCCDTTTRDTCITLSSSLGTGVIAFYPFGYGSLADLSGGNHDLVNPTTAYPTTDRSGNPTCAYHFDEVNGDFLVIPASSGSTFLDNMTTSPFSISLWYQPIGPRSPGVYELLIGRGTAASVLHCPDTWEEWSIGLYDCRQAVAGFDQYNLWENAAGGVGCSVFQAGVTGSWHHLVLIYDGTTRSLYVDGVLYTTLGGPCGAMSANVGELMLGKDYTGDLDDIVIYNRALTVGEVAMLGQLSGSCCDDAGSSMKPAINTPVKHTQEIKTGVRIFPNPANDRVFISANSETVRSISIFSSTGSLAGTYQFNAQDVSVDISKLAAGIYFIKVTTGSETTMEKLIKN